MSPPVHPFVTTAELVRQRLYPSTMQFLSIERVRRRIIHQFSLTWQLSNSIFC